MASSDLTGDACGAQNPLMRLVGHMTQDRAFRQEGIGQGMSSSAQSHAPQTFKMDELLQNIEGLNVVGKPEQNVPMIESAVPSRSGFKTLDKHDLSLHPSTLQGNEQSPHFMQTNSRFLFQHQPLGPDATVQIGGDTWASNYLSKVDDIIVDKDNKGEIAGRERNDEALKEAAQDFLRDIKDDDIQGTSFMNYVRELAGSVDDNYKDLQELDEGLRNSRSRTYDYDDEVAFWQGLEETYQKHFLSEMDNTEYASAKRNPVDRYEFAKENEHLSDEDPFAKGQSFLKEGNIPEAVLCFEAAVQKQPDRAEAWERLGLVLAENEQEMDAITACQACLELQPDNGDALLSLARSFTNEMLNRDACLALRNWLRTQTKYSHLFSRESEDGGKSDAMHSIPSGSFERMRSYVGKEEFDNTEALLLKAVCSNPTQIDPDLQMALGILYNVSGDYSKAVDCFETALKVRDEDPLLWNKLGATLANSRNSELAVTAYQKALELAPGLVRARSNLSIACIEMGAYWEAIEQGLIAVNLQAKSTAKTTSPITPSVPAENIWSLMRMAVMRMDSDARLSKLEASGQGAAAAMTRQDLLNLISERNMSRLNELFQIFS